LRRRDGGRERQHLLTAKWIPAFAGMTAGVGLRVSGLSKARRSLPNRTLSGVMPAQAQLHFRMPMTQSSAPQWIPAFAGMTSGAGPRVSGLKSAPFAAEPHAFWRHARASGHPFQDANDAIVRAAIDGGKARAA